MLNFSHGQAQTEVSGMSCFSGSLAEPVPEDCCLVLQKPMGFLPPVRKNVKFNKIRKIAGWAYHLTLLTRCLLQCCCGPSFVLDLGSCRARMATDHALPPFPPLCLRGQNMSYVHWLSLFKWPLNIN